MKYGIYYAFWGKQWGEDYIPYIRKVKRLGFDILEVGCQGFQNESFETCRELGKVAKEEGIILTGGYGPDAAHCISSSNDKIVSQAFDKYRDMFEKMAAADIHLLGGGLYSYWPVDYSAPFDKKDDWERSVTNMKKLADYASEYDICLNMEVLNRFEGYLLNTAEEGLQYVKDVDRPNVKLMLDTFHMNIEEDDFKDAILSSKSFLGHFHIGEANRRPPFKGGRIPWQEIGDALNAIDYQGAVVMEPFIKMGGEIGRDIRIWHDLSCGCSDDTMDQLASASLSFIRNTFERE